MLVGKPVIFRWVVTAVIVLAAMTWGYFIIKDNQNKQHKQHALPVYGEKINGNEHRVSDFKLINQDGKTVTQDNFKDKIYVADFFFVQCEGICPLMSDQMERIADSYRNNTDVLLLSHTVKPEEDSVPVLKKYAEEHHADPGKWHFVTGERKHINRLANAVYLVGDTVENPESDFVHTQYFALVDKGKRIRGLYDGTDSTEVNQLISDIALLLNEE
jgi:protein SCO1/2